MSDTKDHGEAVAKLGELIKDVKIAMLTTVDPDGSLRSRPMATMGTKDGFDGTLWFFTKDDSGKVGEIDREHQVNLSYSDPSHQNYVSVSGTATVVHDKAKNEELWTPLFKAWFPKGLDDPHMALLKVTVEKAEYWDTPSSAIVHLFGFIKATVTGKAAKPGDHAKIDM